MLYFVAVTFDTKVHCQALGFTRTVYVYVEAPSENQAKVKAGEHFVAKYPNLKAMATVEPAYRQDRSNHSFIL